MSCLLRLSTPLESNFKALFSSRNRLRALSDAIVLLAGRCHVGHKNTYRLHSHGSACTLVAGTQDVALDVHLTQYTNNNFLGDVVTAIVLQILSCAQWGLRHTNRSPRMHRTIWFIFWALFLVIRVLRYVNFFQTQSPTFLPSPNLKPWHVKSVQHLIFAVPVANDQYDIKK